MLGSNFIKKNDRIIDILVVLYIIGVFTLDRNEPAVILVNMLVYGISILIFIKKINQREFVYNLPLILLFGFAIFGILSSIWSFNSMISLEKGINILIKTVFIFLLYNNYYEKKNLHFLVKSFILAGVILCIYQIMEYGLFNYLKMFFNMGHRMYSDILNVNELGLMIGFCFLLAINYVFDKKLKYIFPTFLFFMIIMGTCSKTAYLLIIVGTMYLFIKKGIYKKIKFTKRNLPIIILLTIAVVALIFNLSMFRNFIDRIISMIDYILGKSHDVSTSERINLYIYGFKYFLSYPILGIGLGTSKLVTDNIISHATYFHSDLIENLACTGLIGTLLFYSPLIIILLKNRKKTDNTISNLICIMMIFISITSCIYSNKYRFFLILIALIGIGAKKIVIPEKIYSYIERILNFIRNPLNLILRLLKIKSINKLLPDEIYLKIIYRIKIKSKLNLNDPQSFNEKLQWLKLNDRNPLYTKLCDKYEVREYIKENIGEEYLIPLLGVYNKFEDIDFSLLPKQFVIKCNHDSGGLVICKDKNKFDYDKAKEKINKSLSTNYYYSGREWPYKDVKPKIIIEKYMEDKQVHELIDYKIMCFNGDPKMLFTCSERFSEDGLKVTFFDLNWKKLPFERHYKSSNNNIKKPDNYDKMIEFSKKLAKDIPFVRVDFYEINGKLYFGELTFYPGSGFEEFTPVEWDYKIGKLIELPVGEKND